MTIKDYFKQVENYNNAVDSLELYNNKLQVIFENSDCTRLKATTYKEFVKLIKEEYVEDFANQILKAEYNNRKAIISFDSFGRQIEITSELGVESIY